MNVLNFAENLIRLRRDRGITQEELADFAGVTKASVSKWENRQSLPDILLLPLLASYFDVTVDELLGYEPQLSKAQIQRIYHELSTDFANVQFEEVIDRCRALVKKYYSCHAFLIQIVVLWMNHFMLAENSGRQMEILTYASDLCSHIISECKEIWICNDAIILKANIDLQFGKTEDVIASLEEMLNPYHLSSGSNTLLIQAYQLAGNTEKAVQFSQMSMYQHLITLVSLHAQYLTLQTDDPRICDETISRMKQLIAIFNLDHLNPNIAAQFHFHAAVIYCMQLKEQEALEHLRCYVSLVRYLLVDENLMLHGDSFFSSLDNWIEQSDLGTQPPRNKKLVLDGAAQALSHPAFAVFAENQAFETIKKSLTEGSMSS